MFRFALVPALVLLAVSPAWPQVPPTRSDPERIASCIEITVLHAQTGGPVAEASARIGMTLKMKDGNEVSIPPAIPCNPKPGAGPGVLVSMTLRPGVYCVEASCRGLRAKRIDDVRVKENRITRLEIRLDPLLCVRGRVVDVDKDRPVAGIVVLWSSPKNDSSRLVREATTDRNGEFLLEDVRPGLGLVMVESDVYRWADLLNIPAENPPALTIKVKTRAGLRVRFTGDFLPEKEAKVVVHDLDRASHRSFWLRTDEALKTWVDEDSDEEERRHAIRRALSEAITVQALRPGRHRIEALWDGKPLASTELDLPAGQVMVVEFGPGRATTGLYDEYGGRVTLPSAVTMDRGPVPAHTYHFAALWDPKTNVCEYCAGRRPPMSADGLRWILSTYATRHPDPETRFSGTGIVIGAPPDIPFRHVQVIMGACADRLVQIYRIYLAVEHVKKGRPPVRGRLPVYLPIRDHPVDKIFVNLVRKRGQCICYVNRRSVGMLPSCGNKLCERLAALRDGPDTMVQIVPGPNVRHQAVVNVVEACRKSGIQRIAFSPVED